MWEIHWTNSMIPYTVPIYNNNITKYVIVVTSTEQKKKNHYRNYLEHVASSLSGWHMQIERSSEASVFPPQSCSGNTGIHRTFVKLLLVQATAKNTLCSVYFQNATIICKHNFNAVYIVFSENKNVHVMFLLLFFCLSISFLISPYQDSFQGASKEKSEVYIQEQSLKVCFIVCLFINYKWQHWHWWLPSRSMLCSLILLRPRRKIEAITRKISLAFCHVHNAIKCLGICMVYDYMKWCVHFVSCKIGNAPISFNHLRHNIPLHFLSVVDMKKKRIFHGIAFFVLFFLEDLIVKVRRNMLQENVFQINHGCPIPGAGCF